MKMFNFSKLSSDAAIAASVQLSSTVEHFDPLVEVHLTEVLDNLKEKTQGIQKSRAKKRGGELTEELKFAYSGFKHDFDLFRDSLKLEARDVVVEAPGRVRVKASAAAAIDLLEEMGDDTLLTYTARPEQLGAFEALKKVYDTSENQVKITEARVSERYVTLCNSYDALDLLVKESADQEAQKSQIPNVSEAKTLLTQALHNLYHYVHIVADCGNSSYQSVASKMDEMLQKFRPMLYGQKSSDEEVSPEVPEEESNEICDMCGDQENEEIQREE